MSIFLCGGCHSLRDSDNGAEELDGKLVCAECAQDVYDEREYAREQGDREVA